MMRMLKNKFLLLMLIPFFVSGCAEHLYTPQQTGIPLMKKKGDIKNSFSMIRPYVFGFSSAYALTDDFAFQLYGSIGSNINTQVSFGNYFPFGNNNVFEIYSGLAVGGGKTSYNEYNESYNGYYTKIFTQINYGKTFYLLRNSENDDNSTKLELGGGLKFGKFLTDYEYSKKSGGAFFPNYLVEEYTGNQIIIEPVGIVRIIAHNFHIGFSASYAYLDDNNLYDHNFPVKNFNYKFTVGYVLDPQKLYKNWKSLFIPNIF